MIKHPLSNKIVFLMLKIGIKDTIRKEFYLTTEGINDKIIGGKNLVRQNLYL